MLHLICLLILRNLILLGILCLAALPAAYVMMGVWNYGILPMSPDKLGEMGYLQAWILSSVALVWFCRRIFSTED